MTFSDMFFMLWQLYRYSEVCQPGYNFDGDPSTKQSLHFTQLIWKESTSLGIGRATSSKNGEHCTYVAARYRLAGNQKNSFQKNVPVGNFNRSLCEKLDDLNTMLKVPNSKRLKSKFAGEKRSSAGFLQVEDATVLARDTTVTQFRTANSSRANGRYGRPYERKYGQFTSNVNDELKKLKERTGRPLRVVV